MEFCLSFPEWATMSVITFSFLFLIRNIIGTKNSTPKLPPGPWRLPLIGHMHHIIGSLPHQKMRDLAKKHGPVMHLQLGELTNIIISSPEAAEQVLRTHDIIFASRPQMSAAKSISYNFKNITFSPYGDYWRQLRKIATLELLTAKRVQSFRSIREEETSKLVELISTTEPGSAINFTRMITSLTYSITSRAAFGKIWEGEDVFTASFEKIFGEIGKGITISDAFPSVKWLQPFDTVDKRCEVLHQQLDEVVNRILNEHRSARKGLLVESMDPQKDHLVDVLLNLQEKENLEFPLSDVSIKAIIMDAFVAGIGTSATIMEWAMSELMKNPKVMEKAQAEVRQKYDTKGRVDEANLHELSYIKMVIKETFRLHPALPLLVPRECRERCVIDGYDIPVNSKIMVNTWAMGRDPKYWGEDADEFKPERFVGSPIDFKGNNNFEFLPFGGGRRSCPGMLFGLAAIELPMAKLLFHFDWELDRVKPEDLDMSEEIGVTNKRKSNLQIIPTPYLPPIPSTN
uniref:4,5,8-trihydroxycasbene synthase n=1 Tax=Euphorbia poissonii TaxID=212962 RepID=A0A977LGA3_9ROSI|nr:cytochrome P450 CYP71-2 [Euphorbia poissonii]